MVGIPGPGVNIKMELRSKIFHKSEPFGMDLMIKLLTAVVMLNPYLWLGHVRVPFIDSMNHLANPETVESMVFIMVVAGGLLVLSNIAPKYGSAFIILGILTTILGCQPCYSDSRNYIIAIYFLYLLSDEKIGFKLIRWQIIILYFAAATNKLFQPDWLSGQYIDHWMTQVLQFKPFIATASLLPELMLGKIIGWFVIIGEYVMLVCFTKKSWYPYGMFLGLIIHGLSIIVSNFVFGSFVAAVLISFIALINWPSQFKVYLPMKGIVAQIAPIFIWTDLYRYFDFTSTESGQLEIEINGSQKFEGFRAWQIFASHHPLLYIILIGYIVFQDILGPEWMRGAVMILLALVMLPIYTRPSQPASFEVGQFA